MGFKADFFLLVLMPAIVFDAGYNLDARAFLRNVGSICMTAFFGTAISTFVIGGIMWGSGSLGWCYAMPPLYALTFGAIISATDPVAVLAVFESLGANPDLYSNVFGEAVSKSGFGRYWPRCWVCFESLTANPGLYSDGKMMRR